MHIHILGICGTFMGGIAALAKAAGHRVTGCDMQVYPPMSTQLQQLGIDLIEGYDANQLDDIQADLYVIGNVVSRGNPLMEAILNKGLPYTSGPAWLGEHILRHKWVLAVAGTHGKTTTSAMLAWILEDNGFAPGYLIGGVPMNFGVSARLGESDFFVIEADEYDTAFFDKRSKFVHYRPKTVILNNLEFDHADIFPDLAAIETQFHHLVRTIPQIGCVVVNQHAEALTRVLARGCWSEIAPFGETKDHTNGWNLDEVDAQNGFQVLYNGKPCAKVQWSLQGQHNRLNALAAIAAAHHIGITPEKACASLSTFQNVKRRMEVKGTVNNITIYDDFAHHPTAIETTIAGLRHKVGAARILAVIEPRSNTMKLGVMKTALSESLKAADRVFAYGARSGKDAIEWDLNSALADLPQLAGTFDDMEALVTQIIKEAQPNDHILIMSNGGFGGIHQRILTELA